MKQTLHIFRTNARHLWPQIALVLALAAANTTGLPARVLFIPACWLLIAMLVYEEATSGNSQFWVTRPYRRTSLVGAKLLFIAVFVNIPLILSDFWILHRAGFSATEHLGGILERQILITLWLVVPPLAIASVTNGIAQFLGVAFPIAVVYVAIGAGYLEPLAHSGIAGFDWISRQIVELATAAIFMVVIVRQYAGRRALSGRILLSVAFLIPVLPASWDGALWVAMRMNGPDTVSPARVEADQARRPEWEGLSCFVLPVRLDSAGGGRSIEPLGAAIAFQGAGFVWKSGWRSTTSFVEHGDGYWQKVCLEPAEYDRVARQGELTIAAQVVLASYNGSAETRIPLPRSRVSVPGIGSCYLSPFGLVCDTAMRREPRGLVIWEERGLHLAENPYGHFHFPVEILDGLTPVLKWRPLVLPDFRRPDFVPGPKTELVFSTATNATVLTTELVFHNVRLNSSKGVRQK